VAKGSLGEIAARPGRAQASLTPREPFRRGLLGSKDVLGRSPGGDARSGET